MAEYRKRRTPNSPGRKFRASVSPELKAHALAMEQTSLGGRERQAIMKMMASARYCGEPLSANDPEDAHEDSRCTVSLRDALRVNKLLAERELMRHQRDGG